MLSACITKHLCSIVTKASGQLYFFVASNSGGYIYLYPFSGSAVIPSPSFNKSFPHSKVPQVSESLSLKDLYGFC